MVCRARRDDSAMVRAGRTTEGQWYLGRGTGRGVWWCREGGCGGSLRVGQVARALRTTLGEAEMVALAAVRAGSGLK